MQAVILAGGRGTRLRPLTDTRPKPLLPFVGEPFAAGLLQRLRDAGCDTATFLVGRDAGIFSPLRALGAAIGVDVHVATEPEPLDTAGAARDLLRGRTGGPFLVCNGDILTDLDYAELVTRHLEAGAVATLALTRVEDTSTFGVVEVDGVHRVRRFVEKPAPGTAAADTVNAGTYVLSPAAFDHSDQGGPLSFERSVFPGLVEAGQLLLGVPSAAFWMDLGTPGRYLAGHRAVLTGRCRWPLGDHFARVATSVLVHRTATVPDSELGPCVTVGARATVEPGAEVTGSALFEDVRVATRARVRDAIIGEGATVAEGAHVPPGAVVAPHATVTARR